MKFGVGQSVPRVEDPRQITGGGRFTDDISLPDQTYLSFYRSPYAHGLIAGLDTSAAQQAPGVLAVYTAQDLAALATLPCRVRVPGEDGEPHYNPPRPILAHERVRFVGQAVAAVVASSATQARAAVELIALEVEELPAVVDMHAALAEAAPILHPEHGSNQSVHWHNGSGEPAAKLFASSQHQVTVELINNRVAPSPLEPRSCLASYTEAEGYTLYNPSQGAVAQQATLAKVIFCEPLERMRVISPDTGGGFGIRGEVHPEACVALFAARQLGRPVKWTGDRSEMFLTDSHGRDNLTTARMGLDAQGRMTSVEIETLANLGAFCSAVGPMVPTMAGGRITGTVYDFPVLHQSVRCVFTNTMPVAAYRGAGRPEACYVMERLIEVAGQQTPWSAIELRRINMIKPQQIPYKNHSGVAITSGEFEATLDMGLTKADWAGFSARRTASAATGKLRGIGLGFYTESSGGGLEEEAQVTLNADGSVDVVVGTYSHGQGHATAYAQIVAEQLGVAFDDIRVHQGDTAKVKFGGGTGGSRSSQMGGMAIAIGCQGVAAQGQEIAAELLQAPAREVQFTAGKYHTADKAREVSITQVASAALEVQFGAKPLHEVHRYAREPGWTFPNGCHVAEVEIDAATGHIEVVAYTAVDDCGRVINPMLAAGQVHGGVAQGLGQALLEQVVYDDYGQLLTGSMMDYNLPRADQLPDFDVSFHEVLEPTNALGVKGIGEGGACGSPPAVVHAALDALKEFGVQSIDMPLTSEKLWRVMNARQ